MLAGESWWLALSAAGVGFIQSLAPAHWFPVVLVGESRKWQLHERLKGALVASLGHVIISLIVASALVGLGGAVFERSQTSIKVYSGIFLVIIGGIYAAVSYRRHSQCGLHPHHGPKDHEGRNPYFFLFLVGFSPCLAALPVFMAVAVLGLGPLVLSYACFCLGVVSALLLATWLASKGIKKLHHPLIEHYGDVLAGLWIVATGVLIAVFGHHE